MLSRPSKYSLQPEPRQLPFTRSPYTPTYPIPLHSTQPPAFIPHHLLFSLPPFLTSSPVHNYHPFSPLPYRLDSDIFPLTYAPQLLPQRI